MRGDCSYTFGKRCEFQRSAVEGVGGLVKAVYFVCQESRQSEFRVFIEPFEQRYTYCILDAPICRVVKREIGVQICIGKKLFVFGLRCAAEGVFALSILQGVNKGGDRHISAAYDGVIFVAFFVPETDLVPVVDIKLGAFDTG